jgi:Na+-translocating ferredoxin:NAD+ oxidoreductase RnfD subunit
MQRKGFKFSMYQILTHITNVFFIVGIFCIMAQKQVKWEFSIVNFLFKKINSPTFGEKKWE